MSQEAAAAAATENTADQAVQNTSSLLEKLNVNERNWKFYAAASIPPILVAGLALWYYSSGSADGASSKKDEKKKAKRKAKKAKKAATKATTADKTEEGVSEDVAASIASVGGDEESPENMADSRVAALDEATRKKLGQSLKSRGNKFFQAKRYEKAIDLYTHALRFEKDPVFFSNRAACYAAHKEYEKTIDDCSSALEMEPRYIKAMIRRAQAYENMERHRESLYDFTSACILEDFKNNVAAESAERVLKKLAEAEARERVEKREPRLPSKSFINGYLNSFISCGDRAALGEDDNGELSEADQLYNEALDLIADNKYAQAIESIEKAISVINGSGLSGVVRADDIYSISGMFNFLKSNLDVAKVNLDKALEINPKHVRSLLRSANLFTEKKDLDVVTSLLDQANEVQPGNAEVYFQKGQAHFLKQDFVDAAKDYERAMELDPEFVYPRIQLGVVQFKTGKLQEAMSTFDEAMKKFPARSDLYNYYGEVLAEQGGTDSAINAFEKATELDPSNPLPLVNQAIAVFQSSGQASTALDLIQNALKADSECELAVAALSQIYLQLGMFEESMSMLRRAVDLAKSEEEMVSAITFRETTSAQYRFMKEHPELLSKMMGGAMPGAM